MTGYAFEQLEKPETGFEQQMEETENFSIVISNTMH